MLTFRYGLPDTRRTADRTGWQGNKKGQPKSNQNFTDCISTLDGGQRHQVLRALERVGDEPWTASLLIVMICFGMTQTLFAEVDVRRELAKVQAKPTAVAAVTTHRMILCKISCNDSQIIVTIPTEE
jgi:hypothetical protein